MDDATAIDLLKSLFKLGQVDPELNKADDPDPLVEQILVTRLSGWTDGPILPFLVNLYDRTKDMQHNRLLASLRASLISYIGLLIAMPTMFSQTGNDDAVNDFIRSIAQASLPLGLLDSLIKRFEGEQDTFIEVLAALVAGIEGELRRGDLLSDHMTPLVALEILVSFKAVAQAVVMHLTARFLTRPAGSPLQRRQWAARPCSVPFSPSALTLSK